MISVAVRKQLGDFTLDAAFEAPVGLTAFFGPSGSGKTSLINIIAGLLKADSGKVILDGQPLLNGDAGINLPASKRQIGYVFQEARLFPHMSVHQNLRYGGTYDEARVIELLGIGALLSRKPATLSGGEQQRVALGRALMSKPRMLLMDEPLAALDAVRKAEIMPYLLALRDEMKIPILYVSHDMSEVAQLATTLVLMKDGQVKRAGPLDDLLADPTAVSDIGIANAGAVLSATVASFDARDGLTTLTTSGGALVLPGQVGAVGQMIRLRVPAQDIILSTERPAYISALNVLEATITSLEQGRGPGYAVKLRVGNEALLARVTGRSVREMQLAVGQPIFAILKATAIAPKNIGAGLAV